MHGPKPRVDLAALGPELAGGYRVVGIEVTQTIQDMAHTVPLVAGKTTIVRLYLDRPDPSVAVVRGEIEISGDGASAAVPSLDTMEIDPALNGDLLARRVEFAKSLNFMLPPEVNSAGTWTVRVTRIVTADTGATLTDAGPPVSRTFDLLDVPPLRIRVVSFRHQGGNPVREFEPRALDHEMFASWLRRAFPVANVNISRVTTDAARVWPFSAIDINAQLTAMRNLDVASGGDPLTHYIGMVADGGGRTFMRGRASAIPTVSDPSAVASAPVGAAMYPWDTDGSYGDWYASHELAHTFGRTHLGTACGDSPGDPDYPFPEGALSGADDAFVGVDVGDSALGLPMRIYRGSSARDVMSYCDPIWMSSYTYDAIRQRIVDEAGAAGPAIPVFLEIDMAEPGRWLSVVGTVDLTDRRGSIDFVQPLVAADVPAAVPSAVTLVLFDENGQELETVPARVKLDPCRDPDEHEEGVVDTLVPHPDTLARIELRIGGEPVASFSAPSAVAEPSLLAIEAAEEAAAAAENLRFNVQVSADGGETWQTVALGVTDPDAQAIKRTDFPGVKTLRRRVLATNGFRTWTVNEKDI